LIELDKFLPATDEIEATNETGGNWLRRMESEP